MKISKHASFRVSHRGISYQEIDLTYALGFRSRDKVILDKKRIDSLLVDFSRLEKDLLLLKKHHHFF